MNSIENRSFDEERALYGSDGLSVDHCSFDGPADGESALKESRNIRVTDSFFNLRYPMWHVENLVVRGCEMTELCRAALWYSHNIEISDTKMHGIKALRECSNIRISGADIISPEFGWSCHDIEMADTKAESEYFMMRSTGLDFHNVTFSGKYSFQYIENASFTNCVFDTKDAFWHAKRVTVTDSVIKGEYLAWHRHPAAVLLQGSEAGRLRDGRRRPGLRALRSGGEAHRPCHLGEEPALGPHRAAGRR